MSYDAFATTFSNSRKNLHWPELEYIITDMKAQNYSSVLDIGCGNWRFLEEIKKSQFKVKDYHGIDSSAEMIKEAKKLHQTHHFTVFPMEMIVNCWPIQWKLFDAILFLASFHHLDSQEKRTQVLRNAKKLLRPNGRIYMTNWNLRDQEKYTKSHRWNGDFDIKIGEFSRYYHGFTLIELNDLFRETGYQIIENRIFDGWRNFLSILSL